MNNFTFCDLKNAAKELKIPKYTTAKTKEDLVKLMRPHAKVQGKKIVSKAEGGRCWSGYKPVKGKKPFEKGSCKKASGGAIYNPTGDPEVSRKNQQIRENMQKARDAKDKNQEKKLLGGRIKYPGESLKKPTKDQNRVIYDPMKDREQRKRMLDDHFRDNMILQMDIVDRIYGGTLPQSFRNTVSELKLIKGGSVPPTFQRTAECKKPPACEPIKKEMGKELMKEKKRKPNQYHEHLEQYKQCVVDERDRQGCPESYGGKKNKTTFGDIVGKYNPGALLIRNTGKTGQKLGKLAQKGVAMTMIAGQPAFLATCGAAGAVEGGPVGAVMGTAVCKVLYDKLVAKHVTNYVDMVGLSTKEIEMAQLLGTYAAKEGVRQADPETARSPEDYMDMGQKYLETQADIQKEKAEDRLQKEMDKKDAQLQKQLDKQQKKLDKQLDKQVDNITKPIVQPLKDSKEQMDKQQQKLDKQTEQFANDEDWLAILNAIEGGKVSKEEIDWDEMDWGSFSKQLERYNSQHKKKLTLPQFAEMILKDSSKYQKKTVRRARFYKNVLEKK